MSDIVTRARELLAGITPGPWIAEYSGEQGNCVIPADAQSTREAVCVTRLYHQQADAEFIAAAPQLVADLTDGVEKLRQDYLKAIQDLEFHAGLLHNAENVAEWMREAARQHRVRLEAAHG
ncbi:hypothetical protein [Mycolicibacterium fortuitum]|uniref:Uncharacterized protein n=1 Tax=Mycolicibacterium fortuitum TaxID=1766 RepID=A0AAE5AB42_MYCFO|nr:hypothetical protein [Mycolicibacterium fortuitum]MDV7194648.1 hypothetical protein [Mycolicibacterium fortuitum]MDV7208647.1 hypothetical protein [Mycolicibacterium fortuitum]MDV7230544.1 hypothetical protein [Mycolicibacterium fortuitum]MDV7261849.1 hypothetical protein [Mycolicibacterium fortuitum]MDV7287041.1 hypothetical protein [Mycolicibacterium fortuitum]